MNSRREFREIKTNGEGSTLKSLLPVLPGTLRLFIFLLLLSGSAFAQNIQTQKYDINDPRNPDCPCHKLQKQADDAYQELLNKEQNRNLNNPPDQQKQFLQNFSNLNVRDNIGNEQNQFLLNVHSNKDNNFGTQGNDNSSNKQKRDFSFESAKKPTFSGSSSSKTKKKKPGTFVSKKLKRTRLKHSKIKKVRPNYSVCYKW